MVVVLFRVCRPFFPPIAVASGYFGYVDYHQFYLGVLGLHMVAFGFVWLVGCGCLKCSCLGGVLLCFDRSS
jgi:hypothetical protein